MSNTYLVTGATGNMGRSVVSTLHSMGHKVHAYTRDSSSKPAQELAANGAVLFQGDFSSPNALSAASENCSGIFIITIPSPEAAAYVQTAVTAFRSRCLADPVVVIVTTIWQNDATTKLLHSANGGLPSKGPHPFALGYWTMNNDAETAVKESGIPHWTILRPTYFMYNYRDFAVRPLQWPALSSEKKLVAGVQPNTPWELVDPHDIGVFAAHALVEKGQSRWEHKCLDMASEILTLEEKAAIISRVSGVEVKAVYRDDREAADLAADDPIGYMHFVQTKVAPRVDMEEMKSYGFPLRTFEAHLTKHRDALIRALNDANEAQTRHTGEELLAAAGQHGQ